MRILGAIAMLVLVVWSSRAQADLQNEKLKERDILKIRIKGVAYFPSNQAIVPCDTCTMPMVKVELYEGYPLYTQFLPLDSFVFAKRYPNTESLDIYFHAIESYTKTDSQNIQFTWYPNEKKPFNSMMVIPADTTGYFVGGTEKIVLKNGYVLTSLVGPWRFMRGVDGIYLNGFKIGTILCMWGKKE